MEREHQNAAECCAVRFFGPLYKRRSREIARVTHATYAISPTMGAPLRPYLCPVALLYVLPFVWVLSTGWLMPCFAFFAALHFCALHPVFPLTLRFPVRSALHTCALQRLFPLISLGELARWHMLVCTIVPGV